MKIRCDFVTNSSSSSFIIATKDVDLNFLLDTVLKEFYVETMKLLFNTPEAESIDQYNQIDILDNDDWSLGVFIKTRKEINNPYRDSDYWGNEEINLDNDEKYYVIDNNCCSRFNWDLVKQIMTKYGISWEQDYCD